MLSLEEARDRILTALSACGEESVAVSQALGRASSRTVSASRRMPPFDNSAMDGYALRAEDTQGASEEKPRNVSQVSTIPAGAPSDREIRSGEAARIFTGAPVPAGADAVVMQEDTVADGDTIAVKLEASEGKHIRRAGEDLDEGDPLLEPGQEIGAGDVGVLASQGVSWLYVTRRPRVAILSTGDELVEIDEPLAPGQIPNSNRYLLAAQVLEAGGIPVPCPIAPDEPAALAKALESAAQGADLVLTSGGVSVGEFDHVRDVLDQAGSMDFWKVSIKPGKPLAFGELHGAPFIGLPGNPVSSFVTFEVFARPAIRKLGGCTRLLRPVQQLPVTTALTVRGKRRELIRATLESRDGTWWAAPHTKRGSGQLSSLLQVEALIEAEPGEVAKGTALPVWLLKMT